MSGPRKLALSRLVLETGEVMPVLNLAPELPAPRRIQGVAIDFDHAEERFVFSVDFEGRDTDLVWSVPRERVSKRFHPRGPVGASDRWRCPRTGEPWRCDSDRRVH